MGRFVTRRRRAIATKSKHPKASFNLVNSSNDFASGDLSSKRAPKPSRRKRTLAAFVSSSTDNSVNLSRISSCAPKSLKEISVNVLPDHTLGSRPRKPIFCSTPSAGHFTHRPGLKSIAVSHAGDQWGSPPSLSVSCISLLNPFQPEVDSLGQSPPLISPQFQSDEKLHVSSGEQEPPVGSFMKTASSNKTPSWSEEAQKRSVDSENKTCESSLGENLFSTEGLERNGQILSATGELQWLRETLKEKCVHVPCTVQLERLYSLAAGQLSGQTTHSSSLGHSSVGHSHRTSETFDLRSSVNCNASSATSACGQSGDSRSMPPPPPQGPERPSKSILNIGPEMGDNLAVAAELKEDCLTRKGVVQMKRLSFLQVKEIVQSRRGSPITHPEVLDSFSDGKIKNHLQPDDNGHTNDDTCASRAALIKSGSAHSEDTIMSDQDLLKNSCDIPQKGRKTSQAPRDKKRTTSTDRSGAARKACVSGLSVNRWRNNTSGIQAVKNRSMNCSIGEMVPAKSRKQSQVKVRATRTHSQSRQVPLPDQCSCSWSEKQPPFKLSSPVSPVQEVLGSSMSISTPLRVSRLNLSSLLADFTPNTHTWSRIKAALSVHRKGMGNTRNAIFNKASIISKYVYIYFILVFHLQLFIFFFTFICLSAANSNKFSSMDTGHSEKSSTR